MQLGSLGLLPPSSPLPSPPLPSPPLPFPSPSLQENLLDSHEFLRWLVERLEQIKTKDTKSLQLYLPLVIKVCAHAYIHACTHAYIHACTHAYTHACTHAYTHAYIYTRTQLHTYTCDLVLFLYFISAVPCIPITNMHAHAHTHTHTLTASPGHWRLCLTSKAAGHLLLPETNHVL